MARKHLVVDGSNIATEGRVAPNLQQLDDAVRAAIAEMGYEIVTVVVDATFGHRIDTDEREVYEAAVVASEIITPPAGAIGRGDVFVLQIADRANADVLSNDSFQEFHGTYDWLFDEGRLIGGKPVPNVGWVFVLRAPVRGPTSRRAVRAAKKTAPEPTRPAAPRARKAKLASDTHAPVAGVDEVVAKATAASGEARSTRGGRRRRRPPASTGALNDHLAYAAFVVDHPLGSVVEGIVDRFSSHGAYIQVGSVNCYVPLRLLGDPPPRSAREVLTLGETTEFVVLRFDPERRGVDVAPASTGPRVKTDGGDAAAVATATGNTQQPIDAEEAPVSPAAKKATARKATAKRAPARKTAARKTTARKTTAKKTAKRAPAKKTTARKTTAKKTAKRAPAKKTAAKKTARKTTAKRAPARKTAAKKTARKTTAKKTTARKTAARKR